MKRSAAVGVLSIVLSLWAAAPAFGQAYGGTPGLDCPEGVVVGDHFTPGSNPAVYVDGELVGYADVDEDGTFSFPLPDSVGAGSHTVTVEGVSASVVCVVEVQGEIVEPPGPGEGGIAFTGASVARLGLLAVALLAAGALMITVGRRRSRAAIRGGGDGSST